MSHKYETTFLLGPKSLRLYVTDTDGNAFRASGFIIEAEGKLFLYTCWHVVAGVDFLNPFPVKPPVRRVTVALHLKSVETRTPAVTTIGGQRELIFDLYDQNGVPKWTQEPHHQDCPDLEAIGLHVPKFIDVVKLPVELDQLTADVVAFSTSDVEANVLPSAGTDVLVFGYPHGYSAMASLSVEPVFLKRSIASNMNSNSGTLLLDGSGAKGMSGAPVIVRKDGRWWLYGIYNGAIFPDGQHSPFPPEPDRHAALGWITHFYLARAFMGENDYSVGIGSPRQ